MEIFYIKKEEHIAGTVAWEMRWRKSSVHSNSTSLNGASVNYMADGTTDPFVLKKWKTIFRRLFDNSSSQEADWGDFYLITKRVGSLYGADSEQMTLTRNTMKPLWNKLVALTDINNDKKIQLTEWCELLKQSSLNPKVENDWINEYMEFMFKLFDVSCDGKLDLPEFVDGMKTCGLDEESAREAFKLMTKNEDDCTISYDRFTSLWREYFFSSDREALGNHLFGELPD
uniref:EF-hand domain-containing protein n=1 Tax=Trichuris muris TaxID=70415 RepID=A0A5S6Q8T3_TRIMR